MIRTDSLPCPKCGARPGQPCRMPSGIVRRDYPHLARRKALDKVLALQHPARHLGVFAESGPKADDE